ncbi:MULTISPECIES: L,D-transpeptidase [unclassified Sinorhizobium]|uniref:L,D-transpeptidase n=1 Tax=unclassified Sinorhizobium TaxID=2613772 RepID=UPI0024C2247E|nr:MULTISPECIES: L,D-transpeptidase [unclassified Sinorhizobium]MDK1375518.1 L,D-transpeptidase [Sinorhizobium sp. 6-70]MDK1478480.1 L,D-transpeptidase [Sinorhizobium sp. 6-117]
MCVSRNSAGSSARLFAFLLVSSVLAGCATSGQNAKPKGPDPYYVAMYGPKPEERFPLAAIDISKVEPRFLRQQVAYPTSEPPGTIIVDTQNRFLYLVQDGGMALRYGIGVGKAGLEFQGEARVGRKAVWPRWTPTSDMVAREPERYGPLAGGMEPGIRNPLGPRALYLFQGNRDTLFRIHGTTEAWSIGKAVSSGCIRLFNPDIIDLYSRVPTDTRVVVLQSEPPMDRPLGAPMSAITNAGQPLSM